MQTRQKDFYWETSLREALRNEVLKDEVCSYEILSYEVLRNKALSYESEEMRI